MRPVYGNSLLYFARGGRHQGAFFDLDGIDPGGRRVRLGGFEPRLPAVRGVGQVAMGSGSALRGLQNGYVRSYAAMILVGAIALIAAIWVVVS